MKKILLLICTLIATEGQALEYEVIFENNQISISKVKIMPQEEIGLHRDAYPSIVIALQGGTITRLEENGSSTDVVFPTGIAVHRGVDPIDELHRSINKGSEPVELIITQLKSQ